MKLLGRAECLAYRGGSVTVSVILGWLMVGAVVVGIIKCLLSSAGRININGLFTIQWK